MNIIYFAAEAAAAFNKLLISYRIYRMAVHKMGIYDIHGNMNTDLLCSAAGVLLLWIFSYFPLLSYNSAFVSAVYLCITQRRIYKVPRMAVFSINGFYMLCFWCFEFIIYALLSLFFGGYTAFQDMLLSKAVFRTIVICLKVILWYAAYTIFCKHLNKASISLKNTYTLLAFSCMGFIGFVFLSAGILKLYTSIITRIWLFLILISIAAAFTFYFFMNEQREEQKNMELLEMRNSLLEENYKTISDIYTSHARLYHDLNNHLNILYQMLDCNQINDAKAYIEKISEPVKKLSKTAWTGIDIVDMILNSKIEKMQKKGIEADINAEFPRNTNVQPHDLCTILGNLIDNAIEATERSGKSGYIGICIRKINHFVVIQISNPYIGNKDESLGLPATSKADKKLHGWGLLSVADTVQKYHGTLKCKNDHNRFIVTVMLFLEEASE